MTDSFDDRLARIAAQRDTPPPGAMPGTPPPRPAPRRGGSVSAGLLSAIVGLCLVAGLVGYAWNDLSTLFHGTGADGVRMSGLERTLYDSMSDEERARMESDPDLQGMTRMQKMLMSH